MAYQMPGPATASGSSNARPTIYPALVSATASYPPRQGSKRSYDEYGAQDGTSNTSYNHNSRAGPVSAMNNTQEHPSKRFRGDEPLVTHRSHPSGSSSGLTIRQPPSSRPHTAGHGHPSFPDASGSPLYLMPEPQPYTTFHLTDPVVLPAFPEPHQAIPQTHWQYTSIEPRTVPSQQPSGSRAHPAPPVDSRPVPNSSADAYAWDLSPMDWFSSSMNNNSVPGETSHSRQAPSHPDPSSLNRHSDHSSAIPSLQSHISRRDVGSHPPPIHAIHASLPESLPETGRQLPPAFLPANSSYGDPTIPYSLFSASNAQAQPILDQPMPTPSTRAPQSRMNPSREPPSVIHHSTHDSHDIGPSASHRSMTYTRRLNPYNFLQPTTSSPSRLRPELPSTRLPLSPPSSTSRSRSNSRHEIPRLNEPSHQINHWTDRTHPEPSNIPSYDMPVAASPLHVVSPPITTTTTTTTTTSMTTRRMSTRAAQRVQEWRQELPPSSSSTGPNTGTRAHQLNEPWDTLFVPSQLSPSPPLVPPPERRNRRRIRTRDSSELFDITPIHPPPSLSLDDHVDDHEIFPFLDHEPVDVLPYDPMMVPLPSVGGNRPRRPRRRNANPNTGVNGSGNRNADVNINDDADPMWHNMATLHRLRRATAAAGDTTLGENTSGAIANQRDRITALMRATFGRRTMRLGRMAAFGSTGDFVHDDDFDDSYEGLMRLSAMIGDVRKGVSSDVLDRLPKGKFSEFVDTRGKGKDKEREGDLACAICLEEYKDNDDCVKMIRCRHFYHAECIQQWLQNASTCPICREGVEEDQDQPFGSPPIIPVEPTEVPSSGPSSRNNRSRQGSRQEANGSSSSSITTASGLVAQWTRAQLQPNENTIDWATRLIDTIPDFEAIPADAVDPFHEDFGTVRRRTEAPPRHEDWLFDDFVPPAPALGPISMFDEDPDILFRPVVSERSTRRPPANIRGVEPIRIAPSPQPVMERVAIPPPLPPMDQEENHNSGFASWVNVNTRPQHAPQFLPPPPPLPRHPHHHPHSGTTQPHLPNAHSLSVVGSSLLAAATAAACPHISQNPHRRYDPPQYPPPPSISHPIPSGSSSSRWGRLTGLSPFGLSGGRSGGNNGHGRASSTGSQRHGPSLHGRRPSSPAPISRSINADGQG